MDTFTSSDKVCHSTNDQSTILHRHLLLTQIMDHIQAMLVRKTSRSSEEPDLPPEVQILLHGSAPGIPRPNLDVAKQVRSSVCRLNLKGVLFHAGYTSRYRTSSTHSGVGGASMMRACLVVFDDDPPCLCVKLVTPLRGPILTTTTGGAIRGRWRPSELELEVESRLQTQARG